MGKLWTRRRGNARARALGFRAGWPLWGGGRRRPRPRTPLDALLLGGLLRSIMTAFQSPWAAAGLAALWPHSTAATRGGGPLGRRRASAGRLRAARFESRHSAAGPILDSGRCGMMGDAGSRGRPRRRGRVAAADAPAVRGALRAAAGRRGACAATGR